MASVLPAGMIDQESKIVITRSAAGSSDDGEDPNNDELQRVF